MIHAHCNDGMSFGSGLILFAEGVRTSAWVLQAAGLVIGVISALGVISREVRGWMFKNPR